MSIKSTVILTRQEYIDRILSLLTGDVEQKLTGMVDRDLEDLLELLYGSETRNFMISDRSDERK